MLQTDPANIGTERMISTVWWLATASPCRLHQGAPASLPLLGRAVFKSLKPLRSLLLKKRGTATP